MLLKLFDRTGDSLARRLTFALTLMVAFVALIAIASMYIITMGRAETEMKAKTAAALQYLESVLALPLWDYNDEQIITIGRTMMQDPSYESIIISDVSGKVIYTEKRAAYGKKTKVGTTIRHRDDVVGHVWMSITYGPFEENTSDILFAGILALLFILLTITIGASFLIRRFLDRPLKQLHDVAENYGRGNYTIAPDRFTFSEFQPFINVLNKMGKQIQGHILELRDREEWFRILFEQGADAVYLYDDTGMLLDVNQRGCQVAGYARDEFLSMIIGDILNVPEGDWALYGREAQQAPFMLECTLRRKDGSSFPVEVHLSGLMIKGRNAYLALVRDITERKRAEEALQKSEDKYRALFENSAIAIGMRTPDGGYLEFNRTYSEMLGYTREELLSLNTSDITHPEDLDISQSNMALIAEGRADIRRYQKRYLHKNGSVVWGDVCIQPLRDIEGRVAAIIGTIVDITDSKRAEEKKRSLEDRLKRSEKMEALGQMAGGVAHDLNNVLGVVSGYSELLLAEIPDGHRSIAHAEKILQSTEKGAAIIQDLLTLARRGVVVSDVINLNRIVSGFIETPIFERIKDHHPHVNFMIKYDTNLLNIKGSPVHLEKMLMNLVSNAAESISGSGEVKIQTEGRYLDKPLRGYDEVREGDYAVLMVSDTGTGIPAESREKIFEPFYTKKTMGRSGTGLGLAIVWGTVKDHNGYIDLQTEVGEGTTFTLYFPATREEMAVPLQKEPMERYMGKGESVLVVDDIAEQRDVACGLLTMMGYHVRTVSSGEEAVAYLKSNKADILVLDMIMAPGMDGLETYQRILAMNPKQRAILVSGFSETERVREAQNVGAGAYVRKPYIMEKIGMAIREELDRKNL